MFNPSRDDVRRFFFSVWGKYRSGQPLEGAERMAIEIIIAHPEYHAILDNPERFLERDYSPALGETNPFLHMSMHLAIAEQLSIDQPAGIRKRFEQLSSLTGDPLNAQHEVMDCLAEMIWQAQRQGMPYDPALYLACLDEKIGGIQA